MSGKIIAVANMKGGVGKTTTIVGLAEALAAQDSRVLIIDLDPQANASLCTAGSAELNKLIKDGKTIDGFFDDWIYKNKKTELASYFRQNASRVSHVKGPLSVSLLASSSRLRIIEREFIFNLASSRHDLNWVISKILIVMQDQLNRARRNFDFILVDCPPGLSILTEVCIRLAHLVIVPTVPDFLSSYGLLSFCSNLWTGEIAKEAPKALQKPKIPYVLITRRRRIRQQDQVVAKLMNERRKKKPTFYLFETLIPEMADVSKGMANDGMPTLNQKWRTATQTLDDLATEVRETLDGARS